MTQYSSNPLGDGGAATANQGSPNTADLIDHLTQFEGPPEQFLLHLLAVQCFIAQAEHGAILRVEAEGGADVLSVCPPIPDGGTAPVWLAQSVEIAPTIAKGVEVVVRPLHGGDEMYEEQACEHLILLPLRSGGQVRGVASFLSAGRDAAAVDACRQRLELTISLLSLYEMRLTLQRRRTDMQNLRRSLDVLTTIHEHAQFRAAGMALVNQIASGWNADRVSLGMLAGRYVQLRALSHTEHITRKMKLVQDIESAMEECLDQDEELIYPAPENDPHVLRATAHLSTHHGQTAIVSMPLRQKGAAIGVIAVERTKEKLWQPEEIETLRLGCELVTAWVNHLYEYDRWFGARWARATRKGLGALVGPRHTWAKITAIAVCAVLLFLVLAKGEYRVSADFEVQAIVQQAVPAPFEGYLAKVFVEVDQDVEAGDVLAELDALELEQQRTGLVAERVSNQKRADSAQTQVEKQIALAEVNRVQAQIDLLEDQIERATIRAPIGGTIVTGDLDQMLGAPVQKGDLLFEIAPLARLRAVLQVPEDQIADINKTAGGQLATYTSPGDRIDFEIERINPVAQSVEQSNVFEVRARLTGPSEHVEKLKPAMKGVAKIDAGPEPYAWIWTRKMLNWVRMKLWI